MKTLFIVLCDIMFSCMVVAPVAGIVWGLSVWRGWAAAGPAKIVCIVALAGCAVFLVASYAVWIRRGRNGKEGDK